MIDRSKFDTNDNWFEQEKRYGAKLSVWDLDGVHKHVNQHQENCEAKVLRQQHLESCELKHVDKLENFSESQDNIQRGTKVAEDQKIEMFTKVLKKIGPIVVLIIYLVFMFIRLFKGIYF